MPEATLKALADHGEIGPVMAADGGDCEKSPGRVCEAGINVDSLAAQLFRTRRKIICEIPGTNCWR